jgi:hypothetical protein
MTLSPLTDSPDEGGSNTLPTVLWENVDLLQVSEIVDHKDQSKADYLARIDCGNPQTTLALGAV